jgi:hypothetical protein
MNGKIIQAFRDNSGVTIHYENGDKKVLNVESICGGITWASVNPNYVCIIGKEYLHDESEDYKIHLLYEIEDDLPGSFHESFTKCSLKLLCRKFFAVIDKVTWNQYIDLKDYLRSRNLETRIDISRTRSTTNWPSDVRFVQELNAEKKLSIPPESILGKQLLRMTEDAYLGVNCHEFYAVQGLVNVIKSFFEQPISNPPIVRPNYRYHE